MLTSCRDIDQSNAPVTLSTAVSVTKHRVARCHAREPVTTPGSRKPL
jgi:hypothetical protein